MSGWSNQAPAQKRIHNPQGRSAGVKIIPYTVFAPVDRLKPGEDGTPSVFVRWTEKLRTNYGSTVQPLKYLMPGTTRIEDVVVVYHADGITPAYLEVKCAVARDLPTDTGKTYRVWFRAETKGHENPQDDKTSMIVSGFELSKFGLYIPTNAAGLIAAQKLAKEAGMKLNVFWCEGEKTRLAVADILKLPEVADHYEKLGQITVAAATLGGMAGIKHTNYELKPPPNVDLKYTMPGVNDWYFDVSKHIHTAVIDNDDEGQKEARALAFKFQNDYGCPTSQIFFVDPPKRAPIGWDDADLLPVECSREERIGHYINTRPQVDWVYRKVRGGGDEIDPDNIANRQKALQLAGLETSYTDTATETQHHIGPFPFANEHTPNSGEIYELAKRALEVMGHPPTVKFMTNWDELIENLARGDLRDLIREETMEMIERGRKMMTDENKPENLFIRMFGLEPTEYHKHAGWHFIRDALAMRLRPALRGETPSPQLFYVLYGNEGSGKSTAARVLAGGQPGVERETDRWTDDAAFIDLRGTETHGHLKLVQTVRGKTIVEFADKALGASVRLALAGLLKNAVNKGALFFRNMQGKDRLMYRSRHMYLFTLNSTDILNDDMGFRRWAILDTTKTNIPKPEDVAKLIGSRELTADERLILEGKNPGLNWAYENLPALFAHMYDDPDAWRGSLNAKPEFLALLTGVQADYKGEKDSAHDLIEGDLARLTTIPNLGISRYQMACYAKDRLRGVSPMPSSTAYNRILRACGWVEGQQRRSDLQNSPLNFWHVPDMGKQAEMNTLAQWIESTPGVPGQWSWTVNPSDDQIAIYFNISQGCP